MAAPKVPEKAAPAKPVKTYEQGYEDGKKAVLACLAEGVKSHVNGATVYNALLKDLEGLENG